MIANFLEKLVTCLIEFTIKFMNKPIYLDKHKKYKVIIREKNYNPNPNKYK